MRSKRLTSLVMATMGTKSSEKRPDKIVHRLGRLPLGILPGSQLDCQ